MHGQTCSRTRLIVESAKKATNKAPDMHWESWTAGSNAVWDRSRLTVEPGKKPRVSSHENK